MGDTISKLSEDSSVCSGGQVVYTVDVMNAVGDGIPLVFG